MLVALGWGRVREAVPLPRICTAQSQITRIAQNTVALASSASRYKLDLSTVVAQAIIPANDTLPSADALTPATPESLPGVMPERSELSMFCSKSSRIF